MFLWLGSRAIFCFLLVSRTFLPGSGVSLALELGGLRVLGSSKVLSARVGRFCACMVSSLVSCTFRSDAGVCLVPGLDGLHVLGVSEVLSGWVWGVCAWVAGFRVRGRFAAASGVRPGSLACVCCAIIVCCEPVAHPCLLLRVAIFLHDRRGGTCPPCMGSASPRIRGPSRT